MLLYETVAAVSTPPGQGGIAIVRLSGPQCYPVAEKVFVPQDAKKQLAAAKGYTAMFGSFIFGGQKLDEGIALCFRAPHSYTGEDVIELSCHGGEEVTRRLLQACLQAGALPAPPGEFTRRAVLNGRLSLTQAEAVMDVISATSRQGVALAEAALGGALQKEIEAQRQKLLALAGHLAAYIDYPEEGVEALSAESFLQTLNEVLAALEKLLQSYGQGAIFRRGVRAAIVGSPNVGKSTLFNLLSGYERAIVTPVAGTTRDVVQESIQLGDVPLLLSDTAGLHETGDVVEAEGIRRSYAEMEQAALVVVVFDGSQPLGEEDIALAQKAQGRPSLGIINKTDLPQVLDTARLQPYFTQVAALTAQDPASRKVVEQAVADVLGIKPFDPGAASLANERQFTAVVQARDALQAAKETLLAGYTFDAAGVYLEDALSAFAALTGEVVSEQILEEVFSRFCVGK